MENVLWLASWYPNRKERYDGDFIQRHARAVAGFCRVHVIHIVKDKTCDTAYSMDRTVSGNLTEEIIYYKPVQTGISLFDRFLSQQKYKKLYRRAISAYLAANGKPLCVHVHVAMKAGLMALWVKQQWNIPYVVSEHWSGYFPEAIERIEHFSLLYRKWLRKIIENAAQLTVVSDHLGKAIQKYFPLVPYRVIPNVVDTEIFFPVQQEPHEGFRLIHASSMNYPKNMETVLRALQLLKQEQPAFELLCYGRVSSALQELVISLGLQPHVFFKGEVPQPGLSKAMQQSDALLLYSRYETFGCVLIEANACGLPVIVSDIEVFHELVKEDVNGVFVAANDPAALAAKIGELMAGKRDFNRLEIARGAAAKYNYKKVGAVFFDLYTHIKNSYSG